MPAEFTIYIDSREQHPLPIPRTLHTASGSRTDRVVRIHTLTRTLPTGDYQLAHATPLCTIERKGSPAELCKNLLTADSTRTLAALTRLSLLPNPYLLLECPAASLFTPTPPYSTAPGPAFDHLISILSSLSIRLLLIDTKSDAGRKAAGELVVRLLLLHQHPPLKVIPCPDAPVPVPTTPTSATSPPKTSSSNSVVAAQTSQSSSTPATSSPASTPTTASST